MSLAFGQGFITKGNSKNVPPSTLSFLYGNVKRYSYFKIFQQEKEAFNFENRIVI